MPRFIVLTPIFLIASLLGYPAAADGLWRSEYGITHGSKVILHMPLTIGARNYQVFIQSGEVKNDKPSSYNLSYDQFNPFCYFEIRASSDQTQTISPDVFEITRVTVDETEIVLSRSIQVAQLFNLADIPSNIVEVLILELRSETQVNVKQLVCADGFADPSQVVMPTLKQIKDTLGQVATLKIAR
ncbi:MAG: hypothetical protein BMS9Abin15_0918 [Gammaproteobacteria bacterium]|nr:MAG: hypothetical protein BMS9Abin15_0918 [Gammaproteobacteria bacterium]